MRYTHKQIQDMQKLTEYHIDRGNYNKQILKTVEELSSLNKVLMKLLLEEIKPHDIELLDEMFDSDYMIFQLKSILLHNDIMSDLYCNVVDTKLERELKRWGLE